MSLLSKPLKVSAACLARARSYNTCSCDWVELLTSFPICGLAFHKYLIGLGLPVGGHLGPDITCNSDRTSLRLVPVKETVCPVAVGQYLSKNM